MTLKFIRIINPEGHAKIHFFRYGAENNIKNCPHGGVMWIACVQTSKQGITSLHCIKHYTKWPEKFSKMEKPSLEPV